VSPEKLQRLRSALFDGVVSLLVAGLATLGLLLTPAAPRATMLPGYVMALALLVRRRRPLLAMSVVSLAALAQVVVFPHGPDPLPYDIAVLIAMYSVVKYAPRMLGPWLAAATVAAGIAIEVARTGTAKTWWPLAIWYAGVSGGVWLMGYTVRSRRAYVHSLEERAATLERERQHLARIAVAEERADIARELHDVVAHSLAVMIVQADGGRYAFDSDPAQARAALSTVAATGREALEDMRRLVRVLRGADDPDDSDEPSEPGKPDESGEPGKPSEALPRMDEALPRMREALPGLGEPDRRRPTIEGLDAVVARARSAGLAVQLEVAGERPQLPAALELAAHRIVQEALTNVLRHAGRHAEVRLSIVYSAEALELSIVDEGGAGPAASPSAGGNGLIGMRERVAVYGGRLSAGPRPDGGWSVEARLPLGGAR
jgi:signal transduction histidine kinase